MLNSLAANNTNPFLSNVTPNLLSLLQQQQQQQSNQFSNLLVQNQLLAAAAAQQQQNQQSNDVSKMLENLINYSNYMKMLGNGLQMGAGSAQNPMAAAAAAAAVAAATNNLPPALRVGVQQSNAQATITSEQQAVLSKLSALSNAAAL